MMKLLKEWRSVGAGVAFTSILVAGLLVVQYLRHSWPYSPKAPPIAAVQNTSAPSASHASHAAKAQPGAGMAGMPGRAAAPVGYAPVTIDPAHAAALQLATALVEEREFTKVLRTVGVVALDETRSTHVHAKVRGWIDGIYVNFIGRKVRAGEPLCSIYSQDVYSAEIEFLSILDRASSRATPDPLLDAARRRLSLWDVPRGEIARLESSREARRTFPLLAPRAGTVVAKQAIEGMYVDPAVELYTLSDLSRVWVLADVYEADIPYVHEGNPARLSIEGRQAPIEAKVAFLYPTIDEATRTRKVRFVVDNPGGHFLPGAFVSLAMELPLGRGLAIPETAIIRTGARSIVFVAHGEKAEHLEPREVTLGPLVGDRYRVESGVSAGDRVAIGAQFLLDSESRLRATSTPGAGHAH